MSEKSNIKIFLIIFLMLFGVSYITIDSFTPYLNSVANYYDELKTSGSWNLPPQFINGSGTGVGAHNWSWFEDQIWYGGGNGTWNNPYIIENITIDASLSGSCFEIVDSNKYFILRNCVFFYSGSHPEAGLKTENVNNSKIMDNRFLSNRGHGIYLISSNNNIIFNNYVERSGYGGYSGHGIRMYLSNYNNLSNNILKQNERDGMYITYSNHNKFVNITVELNLANGIRASLCEYSLFSQNTISENGWQSLGLGIISDHCSHSIFLNNIVWKNGAEGIDISAAYNMTFLHNNIIGNLNTGLSLYEIHESLFFNNSVDYNNEVGMQLISSDNNNITENSVYYNLKDGMNLNNCNNNTIQYNEIMHNNQNGIELYSDCDMNNITGNSINNNHLYGLYLRRSDNNTIIENNLIGNENCIFEIQCIGNIFIDNFCNRTINVYIKIISQIFTAEDFNFTFYIYNVNNSGLIVNSILMWWNGNNVSNDIQNLGDGFYFISLEPITVIPGEDPILLNMTISVDGYEDTYFETYIAVDPDTLDKTIPKKKEPIIPGYSIILLIGLISMLSIFLIKKRIK